MNEGTVRVDKPKPNSDLSPKAPVSRGGLKTTIGIVVGIALLVLAAIIVARYKDNSNEDGQRSPREEKRVVKSLGQNKKVVDQEQEVDLTPKPPRYGMVTMTINDIVDVDIGPMRNVEWDPVANVAYDLYINGKFTHHYPAYKPGNPANPVLNIQERHKRGFRLSPGQGVNELQLKICDYHWNSPKPKDWGAKALASQQ